MTNHDLYSPLPPRKLLTTLWSYPAHLTSPAGPSNEKTGTQSLFCKGYDRCSWASHQIENQQNCHTYWTYLQEASTELLCIPAKLSLLMIGTNGWRHEYSACKLTGTKSSNSFRLGDARSARSPTPEGKVYQFMPFNILCPDLFKCRVSSLLALLFEQPSVLPFSAAQVLASHQNMLEERIIFSFAEDIPWLRLHQELLHPEKLQERKDKS